MTSISMQNFSPDLTQGMLQVRQGETVALPENGEVIAHIVPLSRVETAEEKSPVKQSGLLWMCELAEQWIPAGPVETLTDEEMDRITYEH